ncbi:MAG: hypothetical protein MJE77_44025 [Proteobacteria bacterium]|nr:hypothetical protein [Pseudomonadota bacterium]
MTLGVLEDHDLYELAGEVVTAQGSGVTNAQINGLLAVIRASESYASLRKMTQHQREKARKDGDRGAERAAFYDRLFKALTQVEAHAHAYVGTRYPDLENKKQRKAHKDLWSGRFALILMTHVAAEHQYRSDK